MRAFINRRAVALNRATGAFGRAGAVFAVERAVVRSELSVDRVLVGMEVLIGAFRRADRVLMTSTDTIRTGSAHLKQMLKFFSISAQAIENLAVAKRKK
jgi:hypothetical protein